MNAALSAFLQLHLFLTGVYFIYRFFLRAKSDFLLQRLFLVGSLSLTFVLPFLPEISIAKAHSFAPAFVLEEVLFYLQPPTVVQTTEVDWLLVASLLYGTIALSMVCAFLFSLSKIRRLLLNSRRKNGYFELQNSHHAFSFFRYIFIGNYIPEEHRAIILQHERVHVKQWHSVDLLLCKLVECVFWINPLIYQFKQFFSEIHETEADQKSCTNSDQYIDLLLQQSFQQYQFSFTQSFNNHHLKSRIMTIKNKPRYKYQYLGITAAILSLSLLTLANQTSGLKEVVKVQQQMNALSAEGEESVAQFPGGNEALIDFITKNLEFPKNSKEYGKVFIQFIVNADGACSDFTIVKSVGKECDAAALASLKKMPKWIPAKKDGKEVSAKMTLPIAFQLTTSGDIRNIDQFIQFQENLRLQKEGKVGC